MSDIRFSGSAVFSSLLVAAMAGVSGIAWNHAVAQSKKAEELDKRIVVIETRSQAIKESLEEIKVSVRDMNAHVRELVVSSQQESQRRSNGR